MDVTCYCYPSVGVKQEHSDRSISCFQGTKIAYYRSIHFEAIIILNLLLPKFCFFVLTCSRNSYLLLTKRSHLISSVYLLQTEASFWDCWVTWKSIKVRIWCYLSRVCIWFNGIMFSHLHIFWDFQRMNNLKLTKLKLWRKSLLLNLGSRDHPWAPYSVKLHCTFHFIYLSIVIALLVFINLRLIFHTQINVSIP